MLGHQRYAHIAATALRDAVNLQPSREATWRRLRELAGMLALACIGSDSAAAARRCRAEACCREAAGSSLDRLPRAGPPVLPRSDPRLAAGETGAAAALHIVAALSYPRGPRCPAPTSALFSPPLP